MGLISAKVEVSLGGGHWKRLEEFGYDIPVRKARDGKMRVPKGAKLLVSPYHLTDNSTVKVQYECDCCRSKKWTKWAHFILNVKEDGSYYCNKCSLKIGLNEYEQEKLINGESFEQWCIDNNREDILLLWDYELNKCKPIEVTYGSKKSYWFKCPKGIHKSQKLTPNLITHGDYQYVVSCTKCNSFAQWGIDNISLNFLDEYWDYEKNNELGIDPWEVSRGNQIKVWVKCQENIEHKSYRVNCGNFTGNDSRCPLCSFSKGEKKIEVIILDSSVDFVPQYKFSDLKGVNGGLLSYDFYIPKLNLLIEYDGEYHYKAIKKNKDEPIEFAEERLRIQQEHDKRKTEYAKLHNINLLRIPYWDYDNIEEILTNELNKHLQVRLLNEKRNKN